MIHTFRGTCAPQRCGARRRPLREHRRFRSLRGLRPRPWAMSRRRQQI